VIEDLFNAMSSGENSQPDGQAEQSEGDPLADLLGGLLGGGASSGAGDLAGMLGGGSSQQDDSMAALAGLLGGGSSQQDDSMTGLASLLGGGSSQQEDSMGAISGGLLGGGGAGMGSNDLLSPIVNGISEKLGLPSDIVRMIVAFVIGKLLSGQSGAGAASASISGQPLYADSAQPGGLDLGGLLNQMASGRGIDADYLQSTGMNEELAQQTGLDPDTATRSLQEVFNLLGGQMSQG